MPTFYVGYRHVLKGRNANVINWYTGKVNVYSNWDLMNPSHIFDGFPDNQHIPGVGMWPWGGGEGDLSLSAMFTGRLHFVYPLAGPLNAVNPASVQYDYGGWPLYLFHGIANNSYTGNRPIVGEDYGHLPHQGQAAPYAEVADYLYHGVPNSAILLSRTLGHPVRYTASFQDQQGVARTVDDWNTNGPAAGFGAFNPYLNHGVSTVFGNKPSGEGDIEAKTFGHIDWPAGSVGTPEDHYGFEHVYQWFGVPSAKAL